jgi:hypothetical protein
MQKQVFIIIGAVIVLILVAVWVYLLFFGTPDTANNVFSNLGLNGEEDTSIVEAPVVEEIPPVVNMERPKLRQLTTKPVAGFAEVLLTASSTPVLYYAEMGTGHIYTIDLESGEEVRISGTTIAGANEAVFSEDGKAVAITSFSNTKNRPLVAGTVSTTTSTFVEEFSKTVTDFSLTSGHEVLYTTSGAQGLTGYATDLDTAKEKTIFSIPFTDATIQWGSTAEGSHFVYPKTSYALEGFLYEAKNNTFARLPVQGFNFAAKANDSIILYNASADQKIKSYIYDRETKISSPLDAPILPEKCLLPEEGFEFVCAYEPTVITYEFPENWYRGLSNFKDTLWLLDATTMTAESIVNTTESGREIDSIKIAVSTAGTALFFINKNDNTLWMYEL